MNPVDTGGRQRAGDTELQAAQLRRKWSEVDSMVRAPEEVGAGKVGIRGDVCFKGGGRRTRVLLGGQTCPELYKVLISISSDDTAMLIY